MDRQQARDVARWRRAERARLIAACLALPPEECSQAADAVAAKLDDLVRPGPGMVVSLYWDIAQAMSYAGGSGTTLHDGKRSAR